MIAIQDLTVLTDIIDRLNLVTDEQIEATGRRMTRKARGEKEIGEITSRTTRALLTLAKRLECEANLKAAEAKLELQEEIEEEGMQRAVFLHLLERVATEMFWVQAKIELGRFNTDDSIGMRSGWMMVEPPPERPSIAAALLGGISGLGE